MRQRLVPVLAACCLLVAAAASPAQEFDHAYAAFDRILKAFVARGGVDYQGLKEHPQPLRAFLAGMNISEARYSAFNAAQKLAYWLNFYNAGLMDAVSSELPPARKGEGPRSVRDFEGLWTARKWDTPFGLRNLNSIEFTYLRRLSSPLWMFGVNRGARGAGAASAEAFTAAGVEAQLLRAATAWAANAANLRVDLDKKQILASTFLRDHLPDLHDAYYHRGQFMGRTDDESIVASFYLKHGPVDKPARDMLLSGKFSLVWMPYDQTLNQTPITG